MTRHYRYWFLILVVLATIAFHVYVNTTNVFYDDTYFAIVMIPLVILPIFILLYFFVCAGLWSIVQYSWYKKPFLSKIVPTIIAIIISILILLIYLWGSEGGVFVFAFFILLGIIFGAIYLRKYRITMEHISKSFYVNETDFNVSISELKLYCYNRKSSFESSLELADRLPDKEAARNIVYSIYRYHYLNSEYSKHLTLYQKVKFLYTGNFKNNEFIIKFYERCFSYYTER